MHDEYMNFYPKTKKVTEKTATKPKSFRFDPVFTAQLARFKELESKRVGRSISERTIFQTAVTNHPRFRQMVKAEKEAHANNKETSNQGRSA